MQRARFTPIYPNTSAQRDADIIGIALARLAGVDDPPPAKDCQRAGQLAASETTKRKADQTRKTGQARQDEAEVTYAAYSPEELTEVARTAGDEQTLRLLATIANLQIALILRK